ncbi:MAG: DUF86 domain-containing protein [Promethearchaeia archaeon]
MKRKEQYKRKFEFIIEKISNLPKNIFENDYLIDAFLYRLQTSIDATMDIIAMLCKDFGLPVQDDYSNLAELGKLNLYKRDFLDNLRRWNGLRNAIVHRYNKIDVNSIYAEKDKIKENLIDFIEKTEELIDEKFPND